MSLSRRQIALYAASQLRGGLSAKELAKQIASYLYEAKKTHEVDFLFRDIEAALLKEHGVASAQVVSAHPLDKKQRDEIEKMVKLSEDAKSVSLEETLDKSIIGGVIVETSSARMDASVRKRLQQLKALNSNQ